jgi:hypothetical protein
MGDVVERKVLCGACDQELGESTELPAAERKPCPSCGSLARKFAVHIQETVRVSSHLSGLQLREDQAIGFVESERQGRKSAANLEDGSLKFSIHGSSPQGEEDSLAACSILLQKLKEEGLGYRSVVPGVGPADCTLVHETANARLDVQVVRAIASQSLWRRLATEGAVNSRARVDEIVQSLRAAITLKAERLAPSSKNQLVLALDATRLPGLGFDAVVRQFRSVAGLWATSAGFSAIWLVGPTTRLTWRLDVQ